MLVLTYETFNSCGDASEVVLEEQSLARRVKEGAKHLQLQVPLLESSAFILHNTT